MFTTPPSAPPPYTSDAPPPKTSTLPMLTRGTCVQYTQPPNGSFIGMPSSNTVARLAPFAPTPRNDTPWVVGFANRLPERRKSENPGACRRHVVNREAAGNLELLARHQKLVGGFGGNPVVAPPGHHDALHGGSRREPHFQIVAGCARHDLDVGRGEARIANLERASGRGVHNRKSALRVCRGPQHSRPQPCLIDG